MVKGHRGGLGFTPGEERQPLHSLEAGQETLELKSLVDMGEPGGTGEWL